VRKRIPDAGGVLWRECEVADATQVAVGVACHRDAAWTVEAIAPADGRLTGNEGNRLVSGAGTPHRALQGSVTRVGSVTLGPAVPEGSPSRLLDRAPQA
jgi:hypothetical protein